MRSSRSCLRSATRQVALRALGTALLALSVWGLSGCEQARYATCEGTQICPDGYQCSAGQCVSEEQIAACLDLAEEASCEAGLDGLCRDGFCQIDLCGNGRLDTYPVRGPEACDGELGRLACADVGADFGLTTCTAACSSDTKDCESFTWKAAITGTGGGRLVTVKDDGIFVVRAGLLSWTDTGKWKSAARLDGTTNIGDVVPLTSSKALVVAPGGPNALALWNFDANASTLLTSTTLTVVTNPGPLRWFGGVALGDSAVLASLGTTLRLYRLSNNMWAESSVTFVPQGCPTATDIRLHWSSSDTVAYGAMGSHVVRLTLSGTTVTCTDLQDLLAPPVAMGGNGVLQWVVARNGRVFEATTWQQVSLDPNEALALDSAVAEPNVSLRLWATSGDDILLYDQGSWWRSTTGSAILRDDFAGRISVHRPLAVVGSRVLAALAAQEVGLVERNRREWMSGWQNAANGEITDLAVDGAGRTWAAQFTPGTPSVSRLALGAFSRVITDLTAPITSMTFVGATLYVGTNASVRKVNASGPSITAPLEGSATLGQIRGLWSFGSRLYALAAQGTPAVVKLHTKDVGAPAWTELYNLSSTDCSAGIWMTGVAVAGSPRLFVICRTAVAPRMSRLLVFNPPTASPTAVEVPDGAYTRVAAGPDGAAWLVGASGRAVRVAHPYSNAEVLHVERKSPVTGKLIPLTETLQDVVVLDDGQVYIAGANQNLFWWDGSRFVRVSASQGGSSSYVALAGFGSLLYAAYESGVDVLFRRLP